MLKENVEGRPLIEKNMPKPATIRTQSRKIVSLGLQRVRNRAKQDKNVKFTALLHHVTLDQLKESYFSLKRRATPGVDQITWQEYGEDLRNNLMQLHVKVHTQKYKAKPSKRCYIPKENGDLRALGIASLEDKIIQHAVVTVLNAIYENDFLGFSYGFREGKGQHDALDALVVGIIRKKVNWILDADIQKFFDEIDHRWIIKFLQHRIADKRILRLIQKWLKAGVLVNGKWEDTHKGCPQGSVISPLLANIYLHYVLDLWIKSYREKKIKGEMIVMRYADDFILGFQHKSDANEFLHRLTDRLNSFNLKLHEQKTKLIRFGRFAMQQRKERNEGKPETFQFLGFNHIVSKNYKTGSFVVKRKTNKKRMRKTLQAIKSTLIENRHDPVVQQGEWLKQVVQGYFNYFAVPWNLELLNGFRDAVTRYWLKALRRRSQRHNMTWKNSELWLICIFQNYE
jgi:group II intron reverse transcriptase/maturase